MAQVVFGTDPNAAPAAITSTTYISACSFYTWSANGNTYSQSGTYTAVLTAANGCDSTATLILNVTPQPAAPTGLACYQTATFNYGTCQWVVTGLQPAIPTLACYQTATFNSTTCQWDVTGTQPANANISMLSNSYVQYVIMLLGSNRITTSNANISVLSNS